LQKLGKSLSRSFLKDDGQFFSAKPPLLDPVTSSRFPSRVDEMLVALRSNVLTTSRLWHKGVARMEIEIAV